MTRTQTPTEIAERLARRGRVRNLAPDVTIADVVARMSKQRAAGLLHDGAGWDAQAIAEEMDTTAAQVRRYVLKARLAAADDGSVPCSDQVDGLMTFAADALSHAMDCGACSASREALRTGKGLLKDEWANEDVKPIRPWDVKARKADRTERQSPPVPSIDAPADEPEIVVPRVLTMAGARTSSEPRWFDGADRPGDGLARSTAPVSAPRPTAPPPVAAEDGPSRSRVMPIPNRATDREAVAPTPPRLRRARLQKLPLAALSASLLALTMVAAVAATGSPEELTVSATVEATVPEHAETLAVLPPPVTTGQRASSLGEPVIRIPTTMVEDDAPTTKSTPVEDAQPTPTRAPRVEPTRAPRPTPVATQPPAVTTAPPPPPPAPEPTPEPQPAPPPPPPATPTAQNWEDLARCESGSNWTANTGNGYYGGLQFALNTWHGVGGAGLPSEASKGEQIARAESLWQIQGWNAWPSCARKLGLR